MEESSPNGWKTLLEKEKLLVTSNFSFSHSVFKRLLLQTRKNQGLFWKDAFILEVFCLEEILLLPVLYPYHAMFSLEVLREKDSVKQKCGKGIKHILFMF